LPNAANPKSLIPQITELRRCAEQAGRDPKSISITAFGAKPEREAIDQYEAAEVERSVFFLPAERADKVLSVLDGYAKLIST
jgi:hypothetical protein